MTNQEFETNLLKIQAGDRDGLEEVYRAYAGAVYAVFLALLKNASDAEDLTADLFVRLWEKAGSYRTGGPHKQWLFTMARNLGRDYLRRKNREEPVPQIPEPTAGPPAAPLWEGLEYDDTLAGLDETSRRIVTLKLLGGFPLREIARITGLPMGTTAWKYRNALQTLKEAAHHES